MKITIFTCNQPRHINLINKFSEIADTVYAVQECKTIFPGKVEDFVKKTPMMQEYFSHVQKSEIEKFGNVAFTNNNVKSLSLKHGELNKIKLSVIEDALKSDYYIVFGSSYIKGDLIQFLIENNAYNLHVGVSPYYRGSSCNFWASFDGNSEFVGATIHMLSKGLDSGDILYHALPKPDEYKPFDLGMEAVKVAQESLLHMIKNNIIKRLQPRKQDKSHELRYSSRADFNDDVASQYLQSLPSSKDIYNKLKNRDLSKFINPYIQK